MFKEKTVFIIGAGASTDASPEGQFPIGTQLAENISATLTCRTGERQADFKDMEFTRAMNRHLKGDQVKRGTYLEAARKIATGIHSAASIDRFIDRFDADPHVQHMGKAAIVYELLKAERTSYLFPDASGVLQWGSIKATWYGSFAHLLTDRIRKGNEKTLFDKTAIISFNYDRCVEQFVIHEVARSYDLSVNETCELVKATLPIHRPYGTIGDIQAVPYGAPIEDVDVFALAANIKTFTEQPDNSKVLSRMHEELSEARAVVFLGFSFYPDNMRLLDPGRQSSTREILATAYGLSETERQIKEREILNLCRAHSAPNIHFKSMPCRQLLREFGLLLTA